MDTDDRIRLGSPELGLRTSSHHAPSGPHQELVNSLIVGSCGQLGPLVRLVETFVQFEPPCIDLVPGNVAPTDGQQLVPVLCDRKRYETFPQDGDTRKQ